MQHEMLENFFKSLLSPKGRTASPGVSPSAGAPAAASGETPVTGTSTSSGSVGGGVNGSGRSQT